jgi:imidazoleglycerol-phosphate dehydratase
MKPNDSATAPVATAPTMMTTTHVDMAYSVMHTHVVDLGARRGDPPEKSEVATTLSTGIGFLDHMLDQFQSHAQIQVSLVVAVENGEQPETPDDTAASRNRFASHSDVQQAQLQRAVGRALGREFRHLLQAEATTSRFACPLDEALVVCQLEFPAASRKRPLSQEQSNDEGKLLQYNLSPYGNYPMGGAGRTKIGSLLTKGLQGFWDEVARHSGLQASFEKIRGSKGHHIIEASFKAFSRALRNLLDGVNTTDAPQNSPLQELYGPGSANWKASVQLERCGKIHRKTKETSIDVSIKLDGGGDDSSLTVTTGIDTLDKFYTTLLQRAGLSGVVQCTGDLWIDEHHTAEDVSIAVGQALCGACGDKAGLNRMWSTTATVGNSTVECVIDLSNRPCFVHNLLLKHHHAPVHDPPAADHMALNGMAPPMPANAEKVGDLSFEMFEHVLDSLVINARMTVHIVQHVSPPTVTPLAPVVILAEDTFQAVAMAFGDALRYCTMVDQRRGGGTASSKGTLSA